MRTNRCIIAGLAAAAVAAVYGCNAAYTSAPVPSQVASAPSSNPYTPTPGFVYFPEQYRNQATKIDDHVENF